MNFARGSNCQFKWIFSNIVAKPKLLNSLHQSSRAKVAADRHAPSRSARGMTETRKLAAILVADVVGYSRLAGADEERTLARLRGSAAI